MRADGHDLRAAGVPATIRIFVVDDHELARRGVHDLLRHEHDLAVVGEASSAVDACRLAAPARPDVVVVASQLPDATGTDLCRRIISVLPDSRVILLAAARPGAEISTTLEAAHAGAAALVSTRAPTSSLVDAIRRVAAGEVLVPNGVGAPPGARSGASGAWSPALSPQERRILGLLAEGLTNREIAARMHLAEKTVKNYVSRLLRKLGMRRRSEAAAYAARVSSSLD